MHFSNDGTIKTGNHRYEAISCSKASPTDQFLKNIVINTLLALGTIPAECLAVRRIISLLETSSINLSKRLVAGTRVPLSLSYIATIRAIGIRKLFAGSLSRLFYCLAGNFATLQGLAFFGSDSRGLFYTALAKNLILPFSLLANARQSGLPLSKTFHFISKSSLDPVVHVSFFFRNLLANSCLLPGFIVRDYIYQALGPSDSKIPTLLGLTVSSVTSTAMNAFFKPLFTGNYLLNVRLATAIKFPGLWALLFRETASCGLIFANSSPRPV